MAENRERWIWEWTHFESAVASGPTWEAAEGCIFIAERGGELRDSFEVMEVGGKEQEHTRPTGDSDTAYGGIFRACRLRSNFVLFSLSSLPVQFDSCRTVRAAWFSVYHSTEEGGKVQAMIAKGRAGTGGFEKVVLRCVVCMYFGHQ